MPDRIVVFAKVRAALQSVLEEHVAIGAGDHLVDDLGFDSVKMASLTIALEDEFGELLLLNDWIAAAGSPDELTVGSLVEHVVAVLGGHA